MPSARSAGSLGSHFSEWGSMGYQTITNRKKAVEKMKAHEKSDLHSQANLAAFAAEGAL